MKATNATLFSGGPLSELRRREGRGEIDQQHREKRDGKGEKQAKLLTNRGSFTKISSVNDFDGKKAQVSRPQRAGGWCEPVGELRYTGP